MSSSSIKAINSGPLIIRLYGDTHENNAYILGRHDRPITHNNILCTARNGMLTASDDVYISSIATSTIQTIDIKTDNVITDNITTDTITTDTITSHTISTINVSTDNLNTSIINASDITTDTITTDTITSHTISTINVSTDNLNTSIINASEITTDTISTINISTDNLNTSTINAYDITTQTISSININASDVTTIALNTSIINTNDITTDNVNTHDITTNNINLSTINNVSYPPPPSLYGDDWIIANILEAPPSPIIHPPISRSTDIYFTWNYPEQFAIGLVNYRVPNITGLTSKLDAILTPNGAINEFIINNSSINYLNYYNGIPPVTGIVLSKVAGQSGIEILTVPDETEQRRMYKYYNTQLSNLSTSGNTLSIWYSNNNPNINSSMFIFDTFLQSGRPSVPLNLLTLNVTASTIRFTYSPPQFIDITEPNTSATIFDYRISYILDTIPGIRFGNPLNITINNSSIGNTSTFDAINLYPDSNITLKVSVRNNVSSDYSDTVSTSASTINILPDTNMSDITFSNRYYNDTGNIRNIKSGNVATNLINNNTSWTTSSRILSPIHTVAIRGATTDNIASLSLQITGASTIIGPSITLNGFPITTINPITNNNIQLDTIIQDKNQSLAEQFRGFYLNSLTNITLNPSIFVPNTSVYTISLTQAGTNPNTKTFSFSYDNILTTPPNITSYNVSFNNVNSVFVSGVRVIYDNPTFNISTSVTNMGNFFYRTPLLSYNNITGTTVNEINLNNITNGYDSNIGKFDNSLSFYRVSQFASLDSVFSTIIQNTVIARNVFGASGTFNGNSISSIVDGPSYNLITNILPNAILSLSPNSVNIIGRRVYSGISRGSSLSNPNVPPFIFNGGSYSNTSYKDILYNNEWDITNTITAGNVPATNEELQITNGKFRSKGTNTSSYLDYRNYFYNNTQQNLVNYSGITTDGIRYATFVWGINTITGSNQYSNLSFTLQNISPNPTITNGSAFINGSKLILFYRFEDTGSPVPTNANNFSSVWLDANTLGDIVTASNYFNPDDNSASRIGLTQNPNISGNTIQFIVTVPSPFQIGTNRFIYLRIGIPMGINFEFSHITCNLT